MKKKLCMLLLGLCLVSISACGTTETSGNSENTPYSFQEENSTEHKNTEETNTDSDNADSEQQENNNAASEDTENENANTNEELADGMHPEFKEAMDSYEAFYNEYCDIVKRYTENPSDTQLLSDYTDMLTKSVEVSEKFKAWENNDLNDEELKYYLDVNNRVAKKIIEVSN